MLRVHDSDWDAVERLAQDYMASSDMTSAVERHRTKYAQQPGPQKTYRTM